MPITTKVRDLIAHALEHGHGNDLPQPVQDLFHTVAEHVEGLAPDAGVDVAATLKELVDAKFGGAIKTLDETLTAKIHEVNDALLGIDRRIEAKFAELLAKASQADAATADTPAEPAAQQ